MGPGQPLERENASLLPMQIDADCLETAYPP